MMATTYQLHNALADVEQATEAVARVGNSKPGSQAGGCCTGCFSQQPDRRLVQVKKNSAEIRRMLVDERTPDAGAKSEEVPMPVWEITYPPGANVRESPSREANILHVKSRRSLVEGRQSGGWVKLENEPGFMMISNEHQGEILQRLQKGLAPAMPEPVVPKLDAFLEHTPKDARAAFDKGPCLPAPEKMKVLLDRLDRVAELKTLLAGSATETHMETIQEVSEPETTKPEQPEKREYRAPPQEPTEPAKMTAAETMGKAGPEFPGSVATDGAGVTSASTATDGGACNNKNDKNDKRHDFGPKLVARCSTCQKVTRNRGDKETRKIYCQKCFAER